MSRGTIPNSVLGIKGMALEGYGTKMAKYVPVEGLAPAIAGAEIASTNRAMLWWIWTLALVVGVVAIALQVRKSNAKGEPRPGWYFWLFVVVGFVAWSLGTSAHFRSLVDATDQFSAWFLALTALALPALEIQLDRPKVGGAKVPDPNLHGAPPGIGI